MLLREGFFVCMFEFALAVNGFLLLAEAVCCFVLASDFVPYADTSCVKVRLSVSAVVMAATSSSSCVDPCTFEPVSS